MIAEIEHFADQELDDVPKFDNVQDLKVAFPAAQRQNRATGDEPEAVLMTHNEAFDQKVIPHKTMGCFIGMAHVLIAECCAEPESIRFRQHRQSENSISIQNFQLRSFFSYNKLRFEYVTDLNR